ncbi:TPA: hypothetical protein L5F01_005810 [Pseudomonas aeruginosa]|uniref:hypothetical protein n=1 Tax=Pseudomonas aeruginosa TaxID=287 RepID=UPI0009A536E0|nr:hypothetical protein [Pseudomonas aeruginosa]EKV3024680.1 hypothetical protein [Pseudomonas aeruginosa]EKV3025614.1 hypothetical protein [Pseudomonas aeruginosa]MBG4635321.1 hypothetical protein [Pseudomonas aeruginosa]MBG5041644.1 hypothetical protein [Pseudomonas aeruginosa]MCS7553748.1 hypothetical protein [Pseudomonas aeruginosa]
MKVASHLRDLRINATNTLIEMEIGEYVGIISGVLENNIFQRKRVRSSKTVYSLLKHDLTRQCVIPPVVLALTSAIRDYDENTPDDEARFLSEVIQNAANLVILDGLQRTYTILDLLSELQEKNDIDAIESVRRSKIRVELYVGLNRLGILYRMLTLNTGQTPMSLRQQIEILYLDYIDTGVDGVELLRETENKVASRINQYNFKDVVEGFNAYLDRDELPIEKADILENINSLEKLSKENQGTELFEKYLEALHHLVTKLDEICGDCELSDEYLEKNNSPFAKKPVQLFKKPQAMSGLGAAIGKLIDFESVRSVDEIVRIIDTLEIDDAEEFLEEANNSLDWLKNNASKIGNAQRTYFTFLFRDLFNRESESYKNLTKAAKTALRKYQAQNM